MSCGASGKKGNKLLGKWQQTQGGGVNANWTDQYEFFEGDKFICSSVNKEDPGNTLLTNGIYAMKNDSLYLYDDKKPGEVWASMKISFYSDKKIILTQVGSITELEKK